MRFLLFFLIGFSLFVDQFSAAAQSHRQWVRSGNRAFADAQFGDAELDYREALRQNEAKPIEAGVYNLGNALFAQERYEEAADYFEQAAKTLTDRGEKAMAYHNLGNAHLLNQKLDESIEAYKQALRLNPADQEAKYNLSFAQRMKRQQEQEQQQQEQQQQEQQQNDEQQEQSEEENQEPQEGEEQEQEQQQQSGEEQPEDSEEQPEEQPSEEEGERDEEPQSQPEEGEESEGEEEPEPQPQPGEPGDSIGQPESRELSRAEMERLLEALKNEELKVQEKLRDAKGRQYSSEKDW